MILSHLLCRIAKAYTVITDVWDVIKSIGVSTDLAVTYLITAVAHVISDLCSAIAQVLTSVVTTIWDWLTSWIPSVVSWAANCTWSAIQYLVS